MLKTTFTPIPTEFPDKVLVVAEGFMGMTEMVLPISLETFNEGMEKRKNGALVQDAFPMLNTIQREFLITGMAEDDQENVFGVNDDEEYEDEDLD